MQAAEAGSADVTEQGGAAQKALARTAGQPTRPLLVMHVPQQQRRRHAAAAAAVAALLRLRRHAKCCKRRQRVRAGGALHSGRAAAALAARRSGYTAPCRSRGLQHLPGSLTAGGSGRSATGIGAATCKGAVTREGAIMCEGAIRCTCSVMLPAVLSVAVAPATTRVLTRDLCAQHPGLAAAGGEPACRCSCHKW